MPPSRLRARRAAFLVLVLVGAAGLIGRWAARPPGASTDRRAGDAGAGASVGAVAAPTQPPPWAGAAVAVVVRDGDGAAVALLADDAGGAGGAQARRLVGGFEAIGRIAFDPGGGRLAFAARRDGRWDLFVADRDGRSTARLTDDPAYDADPAWSPDGRAVAYSAVHDGRLALFRVDVPADGGPPATPVRLTDGDGPALEPSWSPDGAAIAFAAWHEGAYRIEAVAPDGGDRRVVAPAAGVDPRAAGSVAAAGAATDGDARPADDLRAPAWAPDGASIAYLSGRHGDTRLDVQPLGADGAPAGPPTTLAPDASAFAWVGADAVAHLAAGRGSRTVAFRSRSPFDRAALAELPGDPLLVGAGAAGLAVAAAAPGDARLAPLALAPLGRAGAADGDAADPDARPGLVDVDVRTSGPKIHAGLADDFAALRAEVAAATGADFLGTLSDLWRPVGFHSSASAYFSWHKTGRAFDTQMEFRGPGGRRDMVLVREDNGGGGPQWRMWLRAAAQDGSIGAPLTTPGWTFSAGGGDDRFARDGGQRAATVPSGYWVDFTALAARHGWRRINANARPGFDWRRDWAAIEYWHYERRDGLRWFEAARQVYGDDELAAAFDPARLRALAIPLSRLSRQGFPAGWHADG